MDPPAPLPRLEFPPHPPPGTEAWAGLDAKQRAALVLEEVVLHMKVRGNGGWDGLLLLLLAVVCWRSIYSSSDLPTYPLPKKKTKKQGDLFIELVQGYLWPWNAETSSSAPGSVTWG